MEFPQGSHIHKEDEQGVVEGNAKLLEEHLKKVDWKYLYRAFLYAWGTVLLCVFTLIVVVRLALMMF